MKPTPHEEIIALAYRYKEGKVSKSMINKYIECIFNWFSFEASNKKGMEVVSYTILFGVSSVQAFQIMFNPKPKRPLPKFQSGCIHGEEIITTPNGDVLQVRPNSQHEDFKGLNQYK